MKKNLIVILESFLLSLLIYIIFFNSAVFKESFLNMNLHPLAILVAFMAIRYGIYFSLTTVFFASFFYILSFIKLERDMLGFFSSFENYKHILIFFFISLFLGRFHDNNERKINQLKEEKEEVENQYELQKNNNLKLIEINERLKNRIITSKESIITLNYIMVKMSGMSANELYTEVCKLVMQFANCDVMSIYFYNKEKNFIRAKIRIGNGRTPNYLQLEKDDPFTKAINSKEAVEVEENENSIYPIYISPIIKNDQVIGFINIERIAYEHRGTYIFEMFKIIALWLNKSLTTAFEKEDIKYRENLLPGTNIVNLDFFNDFLNEEQKRKKIFNTNFLVLEAKNHGYSPEEVEKAFKSSIRGTDLLGMTNDTIRILFYNTEIAMKDSLIERVNNKLEKVGFYEI